MSTQKNEQYHILSPEWLKKNPLPDDAQYIAKEAEDGNWPWLPSRLRGIVLDDVDAEECRYRTRRTDLPPDAYVTPPTDTTGCTNHFTDGSKIFPNKKCCDDTTGSGREGETPETDAFSARLIPKNGRGEPLYMQALTEWRELSERLERQRDAALAQVEALRRDGAELSVKLAPIYHQLCVLKMSHPHWVQSEWLNTLRAAIDSAQRQEKP